ncbi:MAG TPA: hypothetical protein V6D22_21545 [Candidatus Obscuribacterales bacterium]
MSCTTLPKLGADLANAAAVSLVPNGSLNKSISALPANLSLGTNFYQSTDPDAECHNCTSFLVNHQAAVLSKPPGPKPEPIKVDDDPLASERQAKAQTQTQTKSTTRSYDATSGGGKAGIHAAITEGGIQAPEAIDQFYANLRQAIAATDYERYLDKAQTLAHKTTSLPNTLLIIGAIFIVWIICALGGASRQPDVVVPVLNGPWYFSIIDYRNSRTYTCNCMLAQQGNEIQGTGMENGARFIVNGFYTFPRVSFVKTFIDVAYPSITFEGEVTLPKSAQIGGNVVRMSGTWWSEGNLPRSMDQVWTAGPQPTPLATIRPVGEPTGFWAIVFGIPPTQSSPPTWGTFFLRIACLLLLLGLGLIFLSVKMFGPAGMLNIWAKKEYVPSQFRKEHRRMLRLYGQALDRGGVPLGKRVDWNIFKFWQPHTLAIPPAVRRENPHMLVIGAGACGKSRLLASMITNDIESGDRAVVLVDSDGSLADLIVNWISVHPRAEELSRRVVMIDPVGGQNNPTFNPLAFPEDHNLQAAASALVFGFKAVYTEPPGSQSQWNQQTADILRNAAILLMANQRTLTDLPVLLSENDFRDVLLEAVESKVKERPEYSALIEAWARYKRMARTDQWINWIEPILNRINPMLGDPRIRPLLTSPQATLDLKDILSKKKVLLVRLPQGHLDQNANLLGSLVVTGLKQAALSLSGRRNNLQCSLYLDEFDNFIEKETFDSITSETKRFGLAFVGAAKSLQQLPEDYRNQLIINVGTLCCFALGKKDGDMLAPQMFRVDGRKIKHQTLQNIFNKVNTTPQFELITDEEKLNIDRVVGQETQTYFCYQVGTIAGVFHIKSPEFADIPPSAINWSIVEAIQGAGK